MTVCVHLAKRSIKASSLFESIEITSALLVTSPTFLKNGTVRTLKQSSEGRIIAVFAGVQPNPDIQDIRRAVSEFRQTPVEQIVALGGGSVIDTAKVLSKALSSGGLDENFTVKQLSQVDTQLPVIAIPTTAGTGSEVTPFATVWDHAKQKKHSVAPVWCETVVHDPSLLLSLTYKQRLYPALDALSHALESLWNINLTPDSREDAHNAIMLICSALPEALRDNSNEHVLADLQMAAYLAGRAISVTKTALAHAMSYPLTLKYNIPHGLACSFTLESMLKMPLVKRLPQIETIKFRVEQLLHSLNLPEEMSQYVDKETAIANFDFCLDKSRAGNFVGSYDSSTLKQLLVQSLEGSQ